MSRWFRLYADAMRSPKVARLSDKDFRSWIELLAVASENDGLIPCLDDLKHLLKRRLDHLSTSVDRLISVGLIDALDDGYEPHNWNKFQYKSDTSTARVKAHRGKRNVSVTPPDTETEADTETEGKPPKGPPSKKGTRLPENWMPSALPADLLKDLSAWPDSAVERELARMRDWAKAAPDRVGVKKDWDATWRNWLRKKLEEGQGKYNGKQGNQAKDGAIAALDRQLGREQFTRTAGRQDLFQAEGDCRALPAPDEGLW